tara:strand:- start:6738 stop:8015 length:1278 start_codon:yes stop_codon:yes gene_type:complete
MNEDKLAIAGGEKIIAKLPPLYRSLGKEEFEAAKAVVETGVLSSFLGTWSPEFYGGEKVQKFEQCVKDYFGVKHAITVNSWTSGLIAAVGAIGIEPGDEIIVTPWTMCATATSILIWNAIPVFADIDERSFNLDPASIEQNITKRTRAIMIADIFGQSADMDKIMAIAKKYDLKVISDTAQAPNAIYKGRYAGTIADIGGFSLNYHKHIHTGEGGVLVTDNDEYADRLCLIRNHAEAVVGDKGVSNLVNMLGFNFRLGEIEAAIGIEQLKKLNSYTYKRQELADRLTNGLNELDGLTVPFVEEDSSHVYYIYALIYDEKKTGVSRDKVYKALVSEGVPISDRYSNVHLLPLFQQRIAYGSKGFPWNSDIYTGSVSYDKGICPVAEKMNDSAYLGIPLCAYDFSPDDMDLIVKAFIKVWESVIKNV